MEPPTNLTLSHQGVVAVTQWGVWQAELPLLVALAEELLQQLSGPALMQHPVFAWMGDITTVQDEGQGLGFVQAVNQAKVSGKYCIKCCV